SRTSSPSQSPPATEFPLTPAIISGVGALTENARAKLRQTCEVCAHVPRCPVRHHRTDIYWIVGQPMAIVRRSRAYLQRIADHRYHGGAGAAVLLHADLRHGRAG